MELMPLDPTGYAYSQAVLVSGAKRLLFISGQVPQDESGVVPSDFPSQYRLAWRNVINQLEAGGMTLENLVKVTIYLSDRDRIAESRGLRQQILGSRSPALTIVLVGIYDPVWLLEIEAIAAD